MTKIAGKFTPGIYNVVVCETQAVPLKDGKGMKVRLRFDIVLPRIPLAEISMTWKIQGLQSFEDLKWNLSQLGVWIDHYDGIRAACTDVVDRAAFAYIDSRRKVRLLHLRRVARCCAWKKRCACAMARLRPQLPPRGRTPRRASSASRMLLAR